MWNKRCFLAALFCALAIPLSCESSGGESGETHFDRCRTDADCRDSGPNNTCIRGRCKPAQADAGGADAPADHASARDSASTTDGESREGGTDGGRTIPDGAAALPDGAMRLPDGGTALDCTSYAHSGDACIEQDDCRPGLACKGSACTAPSGGCSIDDECGHLARCVGAVVSYACVSRTKLCVDSTDCAIGSRCDDKGTCQKGPVAGDATIDGECARGYFADLGGVCRTRSRDGELCYCSDAATCNAQGVDETFYTQCVEEAVCNNPLRSSGVAFCALPGTGDCGPALCRSGYACIFGRNTGPDDAGGCVAQNAGAGEACSTAVAACVDPDCVDRAECKKGLYCASGTCAAVPGAGEPCVPGLRFPCGADEYCDSGGVCRADAKEGAPCDAPALCETSTACHRSVDVTGTCNDTTCLPDDCTPGCTAATCGDGVKCCGLEQCDDGNTRSGDGCSANCNWEPVGVTTTGGTSCALGGNGLVKCWGKANSALGLDELKAYGSGPDQMGVHLPIVHLGTGLYAERIWRANGNNCALLRGAGLKCWGSNLYGQLGTWNSTGDRGDDPGEMGDRLPIMDFGTGRTVKSLSMTCVVLDDGSVKCWWGAGSPNAGLANAPPGTRGLMGDDLPAMDLGSTQRAVAIDGTTTQCVVFEDGSVKCWGNNIAGQLGQGTLSSIYTPADLPPIALGTGRKATSVTVGQFHACALLEGGTVKCWGQGGVLGVGDMNARGDAPGEMGDALPTVDLGTGRTASMIVANDVATCAILDHGDVKCWGANGYGELGQGDTLPRGGVPSDMGDHLKTVDLGTGRTARSISAGFESVCALLDNGVVKCWGYNDSGALGLGDQQHRGDQPGEMGDDLPAVDLTF